jgi:hypothetical protein
MVLFDTTIVSTWPVSRSNTRKSFQLICLYQIRIYNRIQKKIFIKTVHTAWQQVRPHQKPIKVAEQPEEYHVINITKVT